MMKKILLSILMTAVAVMTGSADTLLFAKDGQGPDNVWSNDANWFVDASPMHAPTTNDTARILGDTAWKPAVVTAPGAVAYAVQLGLFKHGGVLTIDPTGTLAVSERITLGQTLPDPGRSNLLANNGELVAKQGKIYAGVSTFENNGVATFNDPINSVIIQPTVLGTVTNNGEFYAAGAVYAPHSGTSLFINETSGTFSNGSSVIMGQDAGATGLLVNKGTFHADTILYLNNGDQTLVNEGTMTVRDLTCQGDASTATITNSGILSVSRNISLAIAGKTIFNMKGGTVTADKLDMRPGGEGDAWTNNSCHVNLNRGTIEVAQLNLDGSKLTNSTIDVTEGVLTASGDVSGTWNWVTGQGAFTAYGGVGDVIVETEVVAAGVTNTVLRGVMPSFPALPEDPNAPVGDFNRDGVVNADDVTLANSYLDGSVDGGADAVARQNGLIADGKTPAEALAILNLTEFDLNGDETFDATDIALLEASIPPFIERAAMNGSGHFEVEVSGLSVGTTYYLMKDVDLMDGSSFVVEADSVSAASGTETLTDTNAVTGQAFYKVTD